MMSGISPQDVYESEQQLPFVWMRFCELKAMQAEGWSTGQGGGGALPGEDFSCTRKILFRKKTHVRTTYFIATGLN